jgi:hypothetical protein
MKLRTASRVAALTGLVVLLAAACGRPSVDTGPLGDGGVGGGICVPVRPGGVLSWGITVLRNTGDSNAVIEKVSLVGADNMQLAASYVVPIAGKNDYGAWPGYPPAPPHRGVEWPQHSLAKGARIPPSVGLRHANLLTVLKPMAQVSKALAIDVLYRESGTEYELLTHYPIVIVLGGVNACPDNWAKKFHVHL